MSAPAHEPASDPAIPPAEILEHLMEHPTEPFNSHAAPGTPAAERQEPATRPAGHTLRVGTMVWGAVVVALGILVIVVNQAGLNLDAAQTAMWLLLGAGVAMVAGGAVNLLQRK
ncbi:hypothetical protein CVV67_14890 [Arthrobacter stackebrandtii]|nr:hypothetical protein CVV67_14890 [Arthrobacter stackebrandtii]